MLTVLHSWLLDSVYQCIAMYVCTHKVHVLYELGMEQLYGFDLYSL